MRQNYEYLARLFCQGIRHQWLWNYRRAYLKPVWQSWENALFGWVGFSKLSVIVWLVLNYGGLRGFRKRGMILRGCACNKTTHTALPTHNKHNTLKHTTHNRPYAQCTMQAHMIWQLTHLVMNMFYKYLSKLRCSEWQPKTHSFLLHTTVAWKWAGFVYYLALRAPWYMRQKENFALEPLLTCIVCRERMCMFVQADSFIWSTYNIHMHPPSAMYFQPPWYPYHFRQEQKFKESNKWSKSAIPRKA